MKSRRSMANAAFVIALVAFHATLFAAFALFARERPREARALLAVSMVSLAYVAFDLWRDPARERFASLSMGLSFMFALLWVGAAVLLSALARRGGEAPPALAWLARRSGYWLASGSAGAIAFGVSFPRLRGFEGASLAPGVTDALAIAGLALALLGVALAALRARSFAQAALTIANDPAARAASAHRAAFAAWASLGAGLSGLVLLVASGFP